MSECHFHSWYPVSAKVGPAPAPLRSLARQRCVQPALSRVSPAPLTLAAPAQSGLNIQEATRYIQRLPPLPSCSVSLGGWPVQSVGREGGGRARRMSRAVRGLPLESPPCLLLPGLCLPARSALVQHVLDSDQRRGGSTRSGSSLKVSHLPKLPCFCSCACCQGSGSD